METTDKNKNAKVTAEYATHAVILVVVIVLIVKLHLGFWRSVGMLILGGLVSRAIGYAINPASVPDFSGKAIEGNQTNTNTQQQQQTQTTQTTTTTTVFAGKKKE